MKGSSATREQARLDALHALRILDTPPEAAFDALVALARRVADCPIALVSLLDDARQWFKASAGLDVTETPKDVSFCRHVVDLREEVVVADAFLDPRFTADHPLVAGPPHVRFYAGFPLRVDDHVVGTLCVLDRVPRTPSDGEFASLRSIAQQVSLVLEHRRALYEIENRARVEARIVAMLTHELRTPLTSICASLRLLTNGVGGTVDERALEVLKLADRNAQRLNLLVDDFLELSRIAANKMTLERSDADLVALLDEAVAANAPYAASHDVELARVGPAGPCRVSMDAHRVRQVVDNLVSNACKFGRARVEVELIDDPERPGFFVRDDGPGIAPEFESELFGSFTQQGAHHEGSGLGLHVSMRIVTLHGGTIDYECPDEGGTIFAVRLPRGDVSGRAADASR